MSRNGLLSGVGGVLAAGLVWSLVATGPLSPAHAEGETQAAEGLRVYKDACVGCHKWHGNGGGGYGGAAASLRKTQLDYDAIVMTVMCGRPGTGMPHFQENAYDDGHCYGLKEGDIPPDQKVAAPAKWLRGPDIQLAAHYVVDNVQGKGEPSYVQCIAFFGSGSRVCETYPHSDTAGPSRPKIDAAPDNNMEPSK